MSDKIIITIDGFSSCGKSSLAKDLSKRIGYRYIDSGAMYRAVTYYCIQNSIDVRNVDQVGEALFNIVIDFRIIDKENHCFLNDVDVEYEIRTMEVAKLVSHIATISEVRHFLVKQQRKMGYDKGIVMDGRDIGTVVFPYAKLKVFLKAEAEIRALRRYEELINKQMDTSLEEVRENLTQRDYIDSNREDSPLMIADDAIILDNSYITRAEQLDLVFEMYQKAAISLV